MTLVVQSGKNRFLASPSPHPGTLLLAQSLTFLHSGWPGSLEPANRNRGLCHSGATGSSIGSAEVLGGPGRGATGQPVLSRA